MSNFEKVSQLVRAGKLKVLSIASPSRTISTILNTSICAHPGVSAGILQPFHLRYPLLRGTKREETAYGLILNAYKKAVVRDGSPVVIVAKEMTRNLVDLEALRRWDSISAKHVLTVRNPLLAIESTMRLYFNFIEERPEGLTKTAKKFAKERGHKETPAYFRSFHNIYAKHLGYVDTSGLGQHWKVLAQHAMEKKDYTMLAEVFGEFFPSYDLNSRFDAVKATYIAGMNDETARRAGYSSLNAFAKTVGRPDWKELVGSEQNLGIFSPLLDTIFATSTTGWEGLRNLLLYFAGESRIQVIDGSILRADPKFSIAALCEHLDLDKKHATVMADWGTANIQQKLTVKHMEESYRAVTARARASTKLELPTERPIAPSRFPEQFRKHFFEVALPLYIQSLCDSRCVRPKGKEALCAMLDKQSGGQSLKSIDPVWAYSLICTDSSIVQLEKSDMLRAIRRNAGAFAEVFDAIDQTCKGLVLAGRGGSHRLTKAGRAQ